MREITKIEFTGYSVSPMNFLTIYFTVNGVYEEEVSLSTISAETNKPIYMISDSTGTGPYYITKRKEKINSIMADEQIIYYEGGID